MLATATLVVFLAAATATADSTSANNSAAAVRDPTGWSLITAAKTALFLPVGLIRDDLATMDLHVVLNISALRETAVDIEQAALAGYKRAEDLSSEGIDSEVMATHFKHVAQAARAAGEDVAQLEARMTAHTDGRRQRSLVGVFFDLLGLKNYIDVDELRRHTKAQGRALGAMMHQVDELTVYARTTARNLENITRVTSAVLREAHLLEGAGDIDRALDDLNNRIAAADGALHAGANNRLAGSLLRGDEWQRALKALRAKAARNGRKLLISTTAELPGHHVNTWLEGHALHVLLAVPTGKQKGKIISAERLETALTVEHGNLVTLAPPVADAVVARDGSHFLETTSAALEACFRRGTVRLCPPQPRWRMPSSCATALRTGAWDDALRLCRSTIWPTDSAVFPTTSGHYLLFSSGSTRVQIDCGRSTMHTMFTGLARLALDADCAASTAEWRVQGPHRLKEVAWVQAAPIHPKGMPTDIKLHLDTPRPIHSARAEVEKALAIPWRDWTLYAAIAVGAAALLGLVGFALVLYVKGGQLLPGDILRESMSTRQEEGCPNEDDDVEAAPPDPDAERERAEGLLRLYSGPRPANGGLLAAPGSG